MTETQPLEPRVCTHHVLAENQVSGRIRFLNSKTGLTIFAITVLCRSSGALAILLATIAALVPVRLKKMRLGLLALLLICPAYMATRVTGAWDGRFLIELSNRLSPERAQSLNFRIQNENLLISKALEQPTFGWGGWGRSRVYDDYGRDISVTDGRWIIMLGSEGLFGLLCDFWSLLLPLLLLVFCWRKITTVTGDIAPLLAVSVVCTMWAIDFLWNNMPNPFYWLCAGAASGAVMEALKNDRFFEPVPPVPYRIRHSLPFTQWLARPAGVSSEK